jgi:hypothetical protein
MRPRLILISALAASGCTIDEMMPRSAPDLLNFRRVAVLPFADRDGLGKVYADSVSRGLWNLGFDPIGREQTEEIYSRLGTEPSDLPSPRALGEFRKTAQAEAVLSGSVECGGRSGSSPGVSFALLETGSGEPLMQKTVPLRRCGSFADVRDVASSVIDAVRREVKRRRLEP